jgi:hypothetical protein
VDSSATTDATQADVNAMSEEVWFKTSTTVGGEIMGWGSGNGYSNSGTRDRYVQMENNGALSFIVGTDGATYTAHWRIGGDSSSTEYFRGLLDESAVGTT